MITSEWGTPPMFEHGLDPEDLLGRRFGHHLNFWSLSERRLTQRVDLGDAHQLVFEVRGAQAVRRGRHLPPRETGSVKLGGIVRRQPHPAAPDQPLGGGPQMVEVSRDGRRVYVTNSIYGAWDPIFYPEGAGPGRPSSTPPRTAG